MHPSEWAGLGFILLTAAVSLALALLAGAALKRTGNRKLLPVMLAFCIFFLKSVLTAYSLRTDLVGHEDLELVGSFLDLTIVLLLVSPFLPVRR
jgi:hypothetical protein